MQSIAIIPLGGVGLRMESNIPKQFLMIDGKPLFIYTLLKFENNSNVSKIVVACKSEYRDYVISECKRCKINKLLCVAKSGKTQLESIFNSVEMIKKDYDENDILIIHVGNRPNVSTELIDKCIEKYNKNNEPLTTYVPCVESMINCKTNSVVDRNDVIRIQTPQVYSFKDIECYTKDIKKYYDKGSTICDLFVLDNKKINYIKGELSNFKITYKEDYDMFKLIINSINKR